MTATQDATHDLVRPLEIEWKETLERVLQPMGYLLGDVARLGPRVAELSRIYNEGSAEGKKTRLPLDARIAFSFPRDVPKGAAAVREIVANGTLSIPADRPLRIVDLGAGLGAITWGVVRALRAAGQTGMIEALLVDEDADVLRGAAAIAREANASDVSITTRVGTVGQYAGQQVDLVILGQVLSEIDPKGDPVQRIDSQTAIIQRLLANADTVVIVEPALRDRTRHLHAVRDRLVAEGAFVHAPCLHSAACPALASEHDWCHDDLAAIDLPSWVTPIAKAAGLRWQGLTFSYLVLRKEAPVRPVSAGVRFRVTSDLLRTKGKVELFACYESGTRQRIRRLDRQGAELDDLHRGDIVTLRGTADEPPIDERGRIAPHVAIDVGVPRQ